MDNIRWLLSAITRGLRYHRDIQELVYDPAYELEHRNLNDYEYTSLVLQDIMNSIHYDMQFTVENQTQFEDGFLPTLDTKLKLIQGETPKLEYEFYKKPVSSKLTILKDSALSESVKSSTISQEIIRRLTNTSLEASQETKNRIIEEYISTLEDSGYSQEEIRRYVTAVLVGFERRIKKHEEEGTPLHRAGANIKKSTDKKKLRIKTTWYKKKPEQANHRMKFWGKRKIPVRIKGCQNDPPSAPIYVQRTVGGVLANSLRKVEAELNREIGEGKIDLPSLGRRPRLK